MLKIYTDSSMSNKEYLENIEAEFNIDELVIDNMYKDELSVYILKMIEGVTCLMLNIYISMMRVVA